MPSRPLVITEDVELLDELLRLAAVAGLDPEVASTPHRAQWRAAPLVLLGADRVAAALELPRRLGVILVTRAADLTLYESGVRVGVTDVIELPRAEQQLMGWLATARAEPGRPPGAVWAVLPGCGGAGASVLAAALAVTAAPAGEVLLVDADPLSGGVDLLLGAERATGLRWPDLALGAAPVPPAALRDALPQAHGVAILTTARRSEPPAELAPEAVATALEASRRLAPLTVVDLPHALGRASEVVLSDADRCLLVVPNQLRAIVSATRLAAWARERCPAALQVVVRQTGQVPPVAVAQALGLPLAGELPEEHGLDAAVERGEAPGRRARGPLGRFAAQLLSAAGGAAGRVGASVDGRAGGVAGAGRRVVA